MPKGWTNVIGCLTAAILSQAAWAQGGQGEQGGAIGTGCNDRGEECYNGTCDGCEEDCSEKTRTIDCYSCCNTNYLGDGATNCQDCCDENVTATLKGQIGWPVTAEAAHQYQVKLVDLINDGRVLTHQQVVATEWLAAAAEWPAIRRSALAIIVSAWVHDQVEQDDKTFVRGALESHMIGQDLFTRDTAYVLIQEFDLRSLITDEVFTHVIRAARGGRYLREQVRRMNPDASDTELSERVRQRREEARAMLRYILGV